MRDKKKSQRFFEEALAIIVSILVFVSFGMVVNHIISQIKTSKKVAETISKNSDVQNYASKTVKGK